jgi:hypothetical protein
MVEYTSKPAQFRLPPWAHEFLAQESSATNTSKTEIVLEALGCLKQRRFEESMKQGYIEMADEHRAEAASWDVTLADGLVDEEW